MNNKEMPGQKEGELQMEETLEAKKWRIISALVAYDYSDIISRLNEGPILSPAGPIRQQGEFEFGETGGRIVQEIDDAVRSGSVAVLAGAVRAGKTSISFAWIKKKSDRMTFDCSSGGFSASRLQQAMNASGVVLDEFKPNDEDIARVRELRDSGKQIVLSPGLKNVSSIVEKLTQQGIITSVIPVAPLSPNEMHQYLFRRFKISASDALLELVTEISGGSLFVANNFMCALQNVPVPSGDRKRWFLNFWYRLQNGLEGGDIAYWKLQRDGCSTQFADLVPDPLAGKISPSDISRL